MSPRRYIGERLGDKLIYGLIMGSLFWGEGVRQRDAYHAANTTGVIWFAIILTGYGAAVYMPQLVQERPIFLRETAVRQIERAREAVWEEAATAFSRIGRGRVARHACAFLRTHRDGVQRLRAVLAQWDEVAARVGLEGAGDAAVDALRVLE